MILTTQILNSHHNCKLNFPKHDDQYVTKSSVCPELLSMVVVVQAFSPSTLQAEAGRSLVSSRPAWSTKQVLEQPGLHRKKKTILKIQNNNNNDDKVLIESFLHCFEFQTQEMGNPSFVLFCFQRKVTKLLSDKIYHRCPNQKTVFPSFSESN